MACREAPIGEMYLVSCDDVLNTGFFIDFQTRDFIELKMAVSRFQIASNKKAALLKQNMREVAVLLADDPPKEEKARIKAEALIRDDNLIEAYDILSLECELLSERIKLIEFSKECPPDLVSCISTLIYATPRVDVPELAVIRKQFRAKYGKKFEEAAMNNTGGVLNERVVTKLSVQPPAAYLVQTYLERICEKYEVDWAPTIRLTVDQMGEPMAPPVGFSVPVGQGTGLGATSALIAATGQADTDQEVGYARPTSKADWVDPPVLPTATAYVPSANSTITSRGTNDNSDDFAEPDIFIPAAPGQKSNLSSTGGSNGSSALPPSAPPSDPPSETSNKKNDGQGGSSDSGTPSAPSGQSSTSYRDLAARFDNLKNL